MAIVLLLMVDLGFMTTFMNRSASAASDAFRVTTYDFQTGEFTGATYTLTLNNNLSEDYFTMVSGGSSDPDTRGPNEDMARITADPHANFGSSTSANQIEITRGAATNDWIGSITIVECLLDCTATGFELKEVVETSIAAGTANAQQTVTDTLAENYSGQTVPFGGRFGGGMTTTSTDANTYATTGSFKMTKTGSNQIQFDRYGGESRVPAALDVTTYIVEWGSSWTVQDVNVTGTASGAGLDATSEYDTASITSVARDNSWVWGNGFNRDDGLGDGPFGQAITLGDGVAQNATETLVAVGSEGGMISPGRDFQVYVMTQSDLQVDYRFRAQGDTGSGTGFQELDITVDSATGAETYDNAATDIQYTEGNRAPLFYNTSSGTGQAYSRTGAWGLRVDADTNLNYWRPYAGQAVTGWVQIVDYGSVKFSNVDTQQQAYRWRDDSTDLNVSGGWLAAENTTIADQDKNTGLRLRFRVANHGTTPEDAARTYEIQFATKAGTCAASTGWTGMSDVTTDDFELFDSANISPDGEATTTALLSNGDGFSYVSGEGRESADTTGSIGPLSASTYTELEYAFRATDDAVTGGSYCFRLYDTTAADVLESYIVYPELTITKADISTTGLGEAGTFSSAVDGGWTTVNFAGSYTTPVVVGTTNTQNGENALVFEVQSVTSTSAQMRVCESEGATANGCDTHAAETVGYMVIDAAVAATTPGIEAGTFSASGNSDSNSVTTNYSESFSTAPYVFANVNTVDSSEFPVEVVIPSTSTTSFTAGICDHLLGSNDSCDGTHGTETVGWVAIEPGNEPFQEDFDIGTVSVANSTWTGVTFGTSFSAAPVVVVASQTDTGGQDVEIDEARLVTTTGAEVRYCEIDTLDTCDTHNADTVAWFAIESGEFQTTVNADQNGFRFYENTNGATPTVALGAENTSIASVDDGDVLRLRLAVQAGGQDIPAGDFTIKLQYGEGAVCSAIGTWNDVGGLGSGTIWRGFDNATPADGSTLPSSLLDGGGNILQTYEEANDAIATPNTITAGNQAEWDWVIENNNADDFTSYCFRAVTTAGTVLQYTRYAQLTTSTGVVNLTPDAPTNLAQQKVSTDVIAVGDVINESTVVFLADVSDQNANDILQLCVEVKEVGTPFVDSEDDCGSTVVYSGAALEATITRSGFTDGSDYHWQARVRDAGGLYSGWVSFGGNAESAADFSIDTTDPSGTVFDGTSTGVDIEFNAGELDELSANWNITDSGSGLSGFEYSAGTSPNGTDVISWTNAALATSFTEGSLTLQTGDIYYINVRATDNAGNIVVLNSDGQQVAPTLTFSTSTSGGIVFDNLNAGNSFTDTETSVVTTSTNARNGYVVRGYTTGSLENALLDTIGGFSGGTYAASDTWQGGDTGYGYTSSDTLVQGANIFSPATCPGGGSGGPCFAPFAESAPGDIVADNPGPITGTPITNEQFTITHRVTTDAAQAYGVYQTTLIFQATATY